MTSVMWFRRDLRLRDHPALRAAASNGPVLGLFVLDPTLWRTAGPARRAWLAASLRSLDESMDGRLCVRLGKPADPGARGGPRGLGRPGARHERLQPLLRRARPRRRRRAARGRRGRRDRHAVRRGAGHRPQRLRLGVPGVHAVQPGLARARLGRPACRPPAGSSGCGPTATSGSRRDARRGPRRGTRGDADRRGGRRPPAVEGLPRARPRPTTTTPATTPAPTAPRGSRRTSSSGWCTPASCCTRSPARGARAPRPGRPRSPGATSTPTCCTTTTPPRGRTSARSRG